MTRARASAVLISVPDLEMAGHIARTLVEERLAASVNAVPGVRSVYRWRGELREASEVLLVAKTASARVPALAARVQALHSYELPAVVALPLVDGSAAYLDWIVAESSE
ncbi:MAG TPA: divalent-cation tolerance protein CutA [Myxococcota bacterium]